MNMEFLDNINFEDMICDFINNTESEEYCDLTDEEVDEIAKNVCDKVANDKEMVETITQEINNTIEYYVNNYMNNKLEELKNI